MAVGSSSSGSSSSADPIIWRELQQELQELVVAHLPLTNIFQLQLLSRKWRDLIVESTRFQRACAESNPKLFAIVSEGDLVRGTLRIRMYDNKSNRWHSYDMRMTTMHVSLPDCMIAIASDGGLLCCVSTVNRNGGQVMEIIVCNPLTRELKALPVPKFLSEVQLQMVQLVMHTDRRGVNYYEVIVAGRKNSAGSSRAGDSRDEIITEVYNSQIGTWSDINHSVSDYVFGYQYSQDRETLAWSLVPMVLDCQSRQLLQLTDLYNTSRNPEKFLSRVIGLEFVKDHLFTLEIKMKIERRLAWASCSNLTTRRCHCTVKEFRARFHGEEGIHGWVQEKKHKISSNDWDVEFGGSVRFYACTGFLLIVFIGDKEDEDQDLTQLYDLSTSTCRTIQYLPDRAAYEPPVFEHSTFLHYPNSMMCELQWDAIP